MKRFILLVVGLFAAGGVSFSQTLRGKVMDTDRTPVENVQIIVVTNDTVTTFTDSQGWYSIRYNQPDFELCTQCLGYDSYKISFTNVSGNIKLEDIVLRKNTVDLDDVTVLAEPVIQRGDRMLVFPKKEDAEHAQNSLDLFQRTNLPGLSVNQISQSISVDGNDHVKYYINGISASLQEVTALNPRQISHIEYQKNSVDIRNGESTSVIHVYLKKTSGTSLSANATGAFTTGFINGNLNLTTGQPHSNFSVNYAVNWRDYDKRILTENESYLHDEDPILLSKEGKESPFGYLQQNVNLGYTFQKNRNSFNIRFLNSIYSSHDAYNMHIRTVTRDIQFSDRNIHSNSNMYIPTLDLYYIHEFDDRKKLEVNLVGSIASSDYQRDFHEQDSVRIQDIANALEGKSKAINSEILYQQKGTLFTCYAGLKTSYTSLWNRALSSELKSTADRLDIYPYLSVNGKIHFLNYTLGTGLRILRNESDMLSKSYVRNVSSASLSSVFGKVSMQYSLFYTPNYPPLSNMTDIVQQQDQYIYMVGNPLLHTSKLLTNNLSFNYNHKLFSAHLSVFAKNEKDAIRERMLFDDHYLLQVQNIESEKNYGAYFYSYVPKLLGYFSLKFDAGYNYYKTNMKDGSSMDLNNWYYSAGVFFNKGNLSAAGGWKKPAKSQVGECIIEGDNNSYVNVTYKIRNLLVGAAVYYPFSSGSKYRTTRDTDLYRSDRRIKIKDNGNMFLVAVVYNINWGKSLFGIQRSVNNVDSSSPLRTINDN